MQTEKRGQRIYKNIMLVIVTAMVTFLITTIVLYNRMGGGEVKYLTQNAKTSALGLTLQNLKSFIEKNYIGEVKEKDLENGAIKGFVEGLKDPYSEYITADEMKKYMQETTGNFTGIGVHIGNNTQTNELIILMPIQDSPAQKAGILSGDIVTKVDGVEYKGEQLSEAVTAMQNGEEGTKVKLEIKRDEKIIEIEVERGHIKTNPVIGEILENNIGYIQISSFDEETASDFLKKQEELQNKGIKALIIDLRNNGGGIVSGAEEIADSMIEKGKNILITVGKEGKEDIRKSEKDKIINIPIVFLVNEHTASASEILVAAVKENTDAKVVGKNTYGKGVIQTIYSISDGSGLKLTTNEYYTPNRNKINKIGIKPDFEVDLAEGKNMYTITKNEDAQIQKAIQILK